MRRPNILTFLALMILTVILLTSYSSSLKKQAYAVLPFGIPNSSSSTDNSSISQKLLQILQQVAVS